MSSIPRWEPDITQNLPIIFHVVWSKLQTLQHLKLSLFCVCVINTYIQKKNKVYIFHNKNWHRNFPDKVLKHSLQKNSTKFYRADSRVWWTNSVPIFGVCWWFGSTQLISYFLKRRKNFIFWCGSLPEKIALNFSIAGRYPLKELTIKSSFFDCVAGGRWEGVRASGNTFFVPSLQARADGLKIITLIQKDSPFNCRVTLVCVQRSINKGKGKAIPLQAWTGPECSRKLRFPVFMTTAQDGGKIVSFTHRPPLPPGNTPGTHFC